VARSTGLLGHLERNRASRTSLYLRSLFSIYDAEDLAHLDLPWWTFGAIDHVDAILQRRGSDMVAFEYGSGASTLWLSRRCRAVYSVEHDVEWAERTRALCAMHDNVEILAVPPVPLPNASARCRSGRSGWREHSFDGYVESIRRFPFSFDLIVIDGRCRSECLEEARDKLTDGGVIVFDNATSTVIKPANLTSSEASGWRGRASGYYLESYSLRQEGEQSYFNMEVDPTGGMYLEIPSSEDTSQNAWLNFIAGKTVLHTPTSPTTATFSYIPGAILNKGRSPNIPTEDMVGPASAPICN